MVDQQDPGRLVRLQAVSDAALSHLDLQALLDELLARVKTLLEVDTCAILLLDDRGEDLVARAAVGIEEEVEQGVRIPYGRGFAGRVAAERRPVVLDDVNETVVVNRILIDKGIRSMLGVPLVAEGGVIGVLHVGSLSPRLFREEDTELLQLAAHRVAMAIDHAKLYAAEREARTRLEQLQAVTDVALAHLEIDELLPEVLQRIRSVIHVDTCAILLLDENGRELVARAALGIEEEVEQGVRIPVGGGFAGKIAALREPVVLPHVDHNVVLNPILLEKGIKSLLGVPLIAHDSVLGVLHVGTLEPFEFGPEHVELLQLVGERVALAIERAKLHEETLRLDTMKLNFVAVASHELRTPATSVYGMLATLVGRRDELSDATRLELEDVALDQAERLRRLIEQLLDLSRLDASSIHVNPQPLVLAQLLTELVAGGGSPSDVEVEVDPGLAVVADPMVIERVISNVVGNARRHGRPPIRVTADQLDRYVRINVSDRGEGVPADLVPRLFERFERGSEGGAGLGLAIAKTYAVAHGGDLLYHAGEQGARFELVLPAR